ncbi:hypothetical protein QE152_g35961 [Popillia japonica]|uniref:Integrase catalytic domain-containing protein n=1 Tax=Popillia japonica TaxID=7064 RepID=A0AAW1IEE9_POPJA
MIKSCRLCEKFSDKNRREPLNVYELPERPWQRLTADIFSYGNHSFLVVMDAYSNWLEVVKIQSKSTEEVIRKFMSIFSKFGCPDTLVCDNIPFGSEKMKAFAREWNFNIVTRSPNYPRSNGLGEKAVGIAKRMVKQSMDTNKDMYSMLMEYRNCPLKHIGLSPAHILFSRMCKTKLPVTAKLLMPKIHSDVREKLKKRQEYGRKYYDQGTKQLKELEEGRIHSESSDDSGNESKMNDVSNTLITNDNTTNTDQAAGLANNMNPDITVTEKTYVTRSGRTVKQPRSLGDYHLA